MLFEHWVGYRSTIVNHVYSFRLIMPRTTDRFVPGSPVSCWTLGLFSGWVGQLYHKKQHRRERERVGGSRELRIEAGRCTSVDTVARTR